MNNCSIKKIGLGTVQFGMDYGINNQRGKIPEQEVYKILDAAYSKGIDILDTAYSYGSSEEVLGKYLHDNRDTFKIISKLPASAHDKIPDMLNDSLKRLSLKKLYGYLVHSFDSYYRDGRIWNALEKLKECGKVEFIGFSLYYPKELEFLFDNRIQFDIVQIPYNIFDRRFEKYFDILKGMNVEVHVRSIFMQGLVFKNPDQLPEKLQSIKDKLQILQRISKEKNININNICLAFVENNPLIDKIIIGVDNISQFNNLIESQNIILGINNNDLFEVQNKLIVEDEEILIPSNW